MAALRMTPSQLEPAQIQTEATTLESQVLVVDRSGRLMCRILQHGYPLHRKRLAGIEFYAYLGVAKWLILRAGWAILDVRSW